MIAHELRRWTGQWTLPAMLSLPALAGVLAMLIRKGEAARDTAEVAERTLASATAVNAFEGVARALHPGLWLLGYVVLGLASQSIAGEYGQGTLRNVLLRPVTRVQVALGKGAALLVGTLVAYLLLVVVAVAVASWAFEWKGVVEILPNGREMSILSADEIWPKFRRALWVSCLPLFAYAGIGFLIGSFARRGATSLAAAIGVGVALDFGRGFFVNSAAEVWLPMTYLPSQLGRNTFVDHLLDWSQGASNTLYLFGDTDVVAPLAWVAVTIAAAAWVLKRRYVP
jgi:ABC-type transport system involved in multi-copper enzyme maturation permease subunit